MAIGQKVTPARTAGAPGLTSCGGSGAHHHELVGRDDGNPRERHRRLAVPFDHRRRVGRGGGAKLRTHAEADAAVGDGEASAAHRDARATIGGAARRRDRRDRRRLVVVEAQRGGPARGILAGGGRRRRPQRGGHLHRPGVRGARRRTARHRRRAACRALDGGRGAPAAPRATGGGEAAARAHRKRRGGRAEAPRSTAAAEAARAAAAPPPPTSSRTAEPPWVGPARGERAVGASGAKYVSRCAVGAKRWPSTEAESAALVGHGHGGAAQRSSVPSPSPSVTLQPVSTTVCRSSWRLSTGGLRAPPRVRTSSGAPPATGVADGSTLAIVGSRRYERCRGGRRPRRGAARRRAARRRRAPTTRAPPTRRRTRRRTAAWRTRAPSR